ncbi:hypothetical protein D6D06_07608 [Aureobasidium pullulans]|nr:hypothetical protein D6D06_07608 [Aureobasidium pullulans]
MDVVAVLIHLPTLPSLALHRPKTFQKALVSSTIQSTSLQHSHLDQHKHRQSLNNVSSSPSKPSYLALSHPKSLPISQHLPLQLAHVPSLATTSRISDWNCRTPIRKENVVELPGSQRSKRNSRRSKQESQQHRNMTASAYLSVLAAMLALAVGAVYMFGVPPQWKRAMEEKALETMGENKASYLVKDQINSLPATDQKDVNQLKSGVGNLVGGALQNPLGKEAGNVGDTITSPLTGR